MNSFSFPHSCKQRKFSKHLTISSCRKFSDLFVEWVEVTNGYQKDSRGQFKVSKGFLVVHFAILCLRLFISKCFFMERRVNKKKLIK